MKRTVTIMLACIWVCILVIMGVPEEVSRDIHTKMQKFLKKFPESDTDNDGVLTESEFKAFMAKRKEEVGKKGSEKPKAIDDKNQTASKKEKDKSISDSILTLTSSGKHILKTLPARPPEKALDHSPADGSVGINIASGLKWAAVPGAESYDVFFGDNTSPEFKGNQTGTSFDTGTLKHYTTYYWRIDAKNRIGAAIGNIWSFTTKKIGDSYDDIQEYFALDRSGKIKSQKVQKWGETQPAFIGKQRVRFGPNDVVSFDLDNSNMNMPFHISGRKVHELGRLNGAFGIDMGYLHGDESGIWSRPYKMLEGIRIDIEEEGQPLWTLNDCKLTTNHFAYLEFFFERDGLEVVRKDLPLDMDFGIFWLLHLKNTTKKKKELKLDFTFEENIRPGYVKSWDIRMGFDTLQQHRDTFVAFDSYRGHLAIAFGGAISPDRTSIDNSNPYQNKGILEYDISLNPGQGKKLDFLCVQYDTKKQGATDSPVNAVLKLFDKLKETSKSQLTAKVNAWENDLYYNGVRLTCPDPNLVNGFYGAKFGLQVMRVDVRNYHPYPCWFVTSTNYQSLFGIDTLYAMNGAMGAGLWDYVKYTLNDINYFGQIHLGSLIYKNVHADPRDLPSTGDGRVQESTMFVGQVWDYARWTGDAGFLRAMYDACANYACLTQKMDTNGDLFPEGMCQPNAGTDPGDQNVDGASYLWWALDSMANMAEILHKENDAKKYHEEADALRKAINEAFWNDERNVWAAWIDLEGHQNMSLFRDGRYHPSVLAPVRLGLADFEKGRLSCETLNSEACDDLGFRGPAHTAWTSGMLAMGNYRYRIPEKGKWLIDICMERALQDDMFVPSFSNTMGDTPPVQRKINYTWSCGPPLEAVMLGMFGLNPNAFEDSVIFTPQLPENWKSCRLEHVKIGDHVINFVYTKPDWTVAHVSGNRDLKVVYKAPPPSTNQSVHFIPGGGERIM